MRCFLYTPFGHLYFKFFFNLTASTIAYIHPLYGTRVQTLDLQALGYFWEHLMKVLGAHLVPGALVGKQFNFVFWVVFLCNIKLLAKNTKYSCLHDICNVSICLKTLFDRNFIEINTKYL
jgi:hypothetical protein